MNSIIVSSIVAAISGGFMAFLDTKIFDNPKPRATYIKIMVMCALIAGVLVYAMGGGISVIKDFSWLSPQQATGGGSSVINEITGHAGNVMPAHTTTMLNGINQSILTGIPNF